MCSRMFPEESNEVEKYLGGLLDMIHRSVMASKPTTMQDAIEFATELRIKRSVLWLNVKPILQGMGKRNRTEGLKLCALNATTIMMGSVLPNAPTARGLVIRLVTVEASLLQPTTTREPKWQIKDFSLGLSVELKAI
ncbi:hypothetical protein Tco_0306730 [Tanacetum coccineum]